MMPPSGSVETKTELFGHAAHEVVGFLVAARAADGLTEGDPGVVERVLGVEFQLAADGARVLLGRCRLLMRAAAAEIVSAASRAEE